MKNKMMVLALLFSLSGFASDEGFDELENMPLTNIYADSVITLNQDIAFPPSVSIMYAVGGKWSVTQPVLSESPSYCMIYINDSQQRPRNLRAGKKISVNSVSLSSGELTMIFKDVTVRYIQCRSVSTIGDFRRITGGVFDVSISPAIDLP